MSDWKPLNPKDIVLAQKQSKFPVINTPTFFVGEFGSKLAELLDIEQHDLLHFGLACRVLKPGGTWEKGRIRVNLEFCPDDAIE